MAIHILSEQEKAFDRSMLKHKMESKKSMTFRQLQELTYEIMILQHGIRWDRIEIDRGSTDSDLYFLHCLQSEIWNECWHRFPAETDKAWLEIGDNLIGFWVKMLSQEKRSP